MRILLSFLLLTACSPHSLEDFHAEGKHRMHLLVLELQKIETQEQLYQAEGTLKKHFEKLVDLMIRARQFQLKNPEAEVPEISATGSSALREEFLRIYAMEGAREVLEKAQQEALVRLDAFEHSLTKYHGK